MTTAPMRAADFIATVGVNAHINDPNSSYATSNVLAQLQYLGVTNVRVSDYSGAELPEYLALGAAGIKFDAVTVIAPQNPINLANEIADLNEIAPYIKSVEGPNEVNTDPVTYNGLTGAAAADAFQADLYHAIQADPALAGAQVLPFSLSVGGSLTGFGNVSAYATEANVHGYASGGVPPYYFLNYAVSSVTTVVGEPVVMSETGYYTLQDGNSGVSQYVQSVWDMDILLQNAADGVVNTYLYQLEDGYDDQPSNPEDHYGLFTVSGAPKQAAVDIHNLTTILADTGANAGTFTPGTLNDTVSGLNPDYGFQEVFAKSSGAFDVALWSEPQFYDAVTEVQAAVTPSQVTVSLGGSYNVAVYDPVDGTAAIQTASDVTSITVALGTDPLIVEVTPITPGTIGGTAPAGVGAPVGPAPIGPAPPVVPVVPVVPVAAPTVVLGSGADTLALLMSEDAYQGDAQFIVTVDGQQIGGVQTAVASHAAGAGQAFDVLGDFAAGVNVATVTFINDDYAGTPSTDRNLYVNAATINGQTIAGSTITIDADGPASFVFSLAPPPSVISISADSSSAPAHAGQVVSFDLTLSQAVSVSTAGGSPTLSLSTGGTASYDAAASTGTSLVFTTTVAAGQSSADLQVTGLSLGGSSITGGGQALSTAGVAGLPGAASGIAVVTATPTVSAGKGADTLALAVSEDAYQGDAQFTVQVNGKQIGGTFTAAALHGAGASQTFDILGNFAAGKDVATVTFLNDDYGGPGLDRNLYVNSATLNGQAIAGGSVAANYDGPVSFGFVVPKG